MAHRAKRGALRALSLTVTAVLLSVGALAPAATAIGEGTPVPALVDRAIVGAIDAVNDITGGPVEPPAIPPCPWEPGSEACHCYFEFWGNPYGYWDCLASPL
jgi:hypothetical protein